MRKLGGNKKTITATPRQLESLVRLSEALAKMRLAPRVERSDVVEAARLVRVALQQVKEKSCVIGPLVHSSNPLFLCDRLRLIR